MRTSKHGTPNQRRGRIIDAGTSCFARDGFYDATFEDIIRESGLSRGTLYWHYSSKDELYDAVVAQSIKQVEGWISAGPQALARGSSLVDGLFESLVDDLQRNEDEYRLLYLASRPPRAEAALQQLTDAFLEFLRSLVDAAVAADEVDPSLRAVLPDLIYALIEGMILRRLTDPGFDAANFARHASHIVRHATAPPSRSNKPPAKEKTQ